MHPLNPTKYKAICFLQEDTGRDVEIVLPIIYTAEKYLNCEVSFELKWNAHLLFKNRPDFVIIPANCIGSLHYHKIAKYAHSMGIKIFSFISEGNFNEKAGHNFFGFNEDRVFYQDYVLNWSQRTINYMTEVAPAQKDRYVLAGAPGFDRYKIYDFAKKADFLKKYDKTQYEKVILYSGWAFGKVQYQQGREELSPNEEGRDAKIKWVNEQRIVVRDALKAAIESNPDTLFLLKQHPAEYFPGLKLEELNEMSELAHYDNVIYVQGHTEGIHDLISVCDILLGFETTTAIESWIMSDKPTIFINNQPDFQRVDIYKGCSIVKDGTELNAMIQEFYSSGKLDDFLRSDLKEKRDQIIRDSIGFSDGLNHLRSAYYLNETLAKIKKEKIDYKKNSEFSRFYFFFKMMKPFYNIGLVKGLPWFKKFNWVFERHELKNVPILKQKYTPFMDRFYAKNGLDEQGIIEFWKSEGLQP